MANTKARGELINVREVVNLTVSFRDGNGDLVDSTSTPTVTIAQPNGMILLGPTSLGVTRTSLGNYSLLFTIPPNGPYGVFQDVWVGNVDGDRVEAAFSFVVVGTNIPSISSDGYKHLGDEYPFNYSQVAIQNINKLIKMIRARLNSSGKVKIKDTFGNDEWVTCDIFSTETLVTFLAMALSYFNSIPYFTYFTFDDEGFIAQFGEILVQGAVLYALASQALIERGREYQISDNGINFTPPTVSELLNSQYSGGLATYFEQVKLIKNSMRPAPLGLGVFSITAGGSNPALRRQRHLKARRLI